MDRRRRPARGGRRRRRRRRGKQWYDLGGDLWRAEDVDIVTVSYNYTTVAKQRLEGEKERVLANAVKLSPQGTALTRPTARGDDGGRLAGAADEKIGRLAVEGEGPVPQTREVLGND